MAEAEGVVDVGEEAADCEIDREEGVEWTARKFACSVSVGHDVLCISFCVSCNCGPDFPTDEEIKTGLVRLV